MQHRTYRLHLVAIALVLGLALTSLPLAAAAPERSSSPAISGQGLTAPLEPWRGNLWATIGSRCAVGAAGPSIDIDGFTEPLAHDNGLRATGASPGSHETQGEAGPRLDIDRFSEPWPDETGFVAADNSLDTAENQGERGASINIDG